MKRTRVVALVAIAFAVCVVAGNFAWRSVQKRQVELAWRLFTKELANDEMESAYASMSTAFRQAKPLSAFRSSRWCDKAHPWFVAVTNRDIHVVYVRLSLLGTSSQILTTTSVRSSVIEVDPEGIRITASLVREGRAWKVNGEPSVTAN